MWTKSSENRYNENRDDFWIFFTVIDGKWLHVRPNDMAEVNRLHKHQQRNYKKK